jgi:uncharacterized integral membrane protein (TIGR00698 family)
MSNGGGCFLGEASEMAVGKEGIESGSFQASLPDWLRMGVGMVLCVAIAFVAEALGQREPLIGAPIFAIVIGVIVTNTLRGPLQLTRWRISEVSKLCLKGGIVLLGASLNFGDVIRTGIGSLPLLGITIAAGLICSLGLGRWLKVDWRMRCLIGMGTTICGASAIAALAPVIRAKAEEIAYAISVIFFFNMLAVFLFPLIGHLLGLSNLGFGTWAGTAVNDTSAVVAAGFAYSTPAGTIATIVKLTRTTLIVPLVIGFGFAMPWLDPEARESSELSVLQRAYQAMPLFIILFLVASLLNTAGMFGHYAPHVQLVGRWVLVVALAAVGLQGHWKAFAGAGPTPLVLGLATWAAVALTSLGVQAWSGQL